MKTYLLLFLLAYASHVSAQNASENYYQFIYVDGKITMEENTPSTTKKYDIPLTPKKYYSKDTKVKFEGKIAVFYDTTYKYTGIIKENSKGELDEIVLYGQRARCECFDCLSTFGQFASYQGTFPMLYPDMVLSLEDTRPSGCRAEPYQIELGLTQKCCL